MLAGFALFRLFDIWKPWPVRWADRRVHGGLGAMLDDVLAGLYALAVLQALALVAALR
jgi:phosphatidylglycerophosphatase A